MLNLPEAEAAISSAITLFLMILLVSSFTFTLTYLASAQMWSFRVGGETIGRTAHAARESLEAELVSSSGGTLQIKVRNRGFAGVAIVRVLFTKPDGSLSAVDLDPPCTLLPNEEAVIDVSLGASYLNVGVQTMSGNIYLVSR